MDINETDIYEFDNFPHKYKKNGYLKRKYKFFSIV